MRRFFPLTAFALASLSLSASMVARAGEEPRPPPYNLIFEGSLPDATILNVAVDAKGVEPIALSLVGGKVSKGVSIPGEGARHLVVTAQNADGKVIYEGSLDIEAGKDFTPQVAIELKSAIDDTQGELTLASHRVALEFAAVEREGKPFTRLTGNVFDANGLRLELKPEDLAFEIDDPRIRETLVPCPGFGGAPPLCVEFEPVKPDGLQIAVDACFRRGICKIEFVPPRTPVWRKVAVSMGHHACALKLSGELYCWGKGENGQLGFVAPKDCNTAGEAGSSLSCVGFAQPVVCGSGPCLFTDVSAGLRHTCAIDTSQDAWCWGDNYNGELGTDAFDPTHIGSPVPQRVSGTLKFLTIHAAFTTTCGLTVTHEVYCWGDNSVSLIPALDWGWANDPRLVATPEVFDSLDISYNHACGLTATGNLYCWGSNNGYELGIAGYTVAPFCSTCPAAPILMQPRIPGLLNQQVLLASTGAHGSCAHLANGTTPCWGWPLVSYPAGRSLDRLSRGFQHYCTISRGNMQCAGMAALGDGSDWHEAPGVGPVQVKAPPMHFRELDTGQNTTCAIGHDENVYCWGSNQFGRLGLGLSGYVTTPTALVFPTKLKVPPVNWPVKKP